MIEAILLILVILGIQGSWQKARADKKRKREQAEREEAQRRAMIEDWYARRG